MKCTPKDDELERYFYTVDEQGSTTLITNNCANVTNEYYYDAFGNVLESREDAHNRITYTGQQFDSATQQYYLRARFYNPIIGRFTQEDIYRGDGLNLYAYCRNNPVRYYDPSGYCGKERSLNTERVGKPEIGKKLEYVFGNATGNKHNIERSLDMENKLNKIGVFDNAEGRSFMENELRKAFYDTTNGIIQENGRIRKESLLIGPNGIAKMESIWDGDRLITVEIFISDWKGFVK